MEQLLGQLTISLILLSHQIDNIELIKTAEASTYEQVPQVQIVEVDATLLAIAECESGNNAKAKNPNSSASGRFQFIKSSWEYYGKKLWGDEWVNKDVFNWQDNTELAIYVYNKNGTSDWLESKPCWSKKIASTKT